MNNWLIALLVFNFVVLGWALLAHFAEARRKSGEEQSLEEAMRSNAPLCSELGCKQPAAFASDFCEEHKYLNFEVLDDLELEAAHNAIATSGACYDIVARELNRAYFLGQKVAMER